MGKRSPFVRSILVVADEGGVCKIYTYSAHSYGSSPAAWAVRLMEARAKRFENERHPVDVHVGKRVRARRKLLKITQADLAACVGKTSQQIQKYETGANRISASMLYGLATALGTPLQYFYVGLPDPAVRSSQKAIAASASLSLIEEFGMTDDGAELVSIVTSLPAPFRRQVVSIAREISAVVAEIQNPKIIKAS